MALTVKRTQSIPSFNLEEMIHDTIQTCLLNKLSLRRPAMIKMIEYFPTYCICKETKDKSVSSVYLRVKKQGSYKKLSVKEIEITGASLIEFFDFLDIKGAKEVKTPSSILDII